MRVLMICPELPRSDNPGTMAPGARQIDSIRDLGLAVDVIDMRGIPKLKYLHLVPRVRRRAKRVDLIHAHFGFCGWLAWLSTIGLRRKPPLVISFMGTDLLGHPYNAEGDIGWLSGKFIRVNQWLAPRADERIVKSQELAAIIAPAPSTIIPNGVDLSTFRPIDRESARRELQLDSDRKTVLFPGNPGNPRKGYQLASDAVAAASQLLGQQIDLVPLHHVHPEQVPVYMSACDVMVMTSVYEGSPNVVKEAMACDTPIVGVPVGDVEQLLRGVSGCELCPRNPQVIGAAITRALDATEAGGRQAILQRGLDLESVARRIVKTYERAIGRQVDLPDRERELLPTSDSA